MRKVKKTNSPGNFLLLVWSHVTLEDPAVYWPGQTSQILRFTRDPCVIIFSFVFLFIFQRRCFSPLILSCPPLPPSPTIITCAHSCSPGWKRCVSFLLCRAGREGGKVEENCERQGNKTKRRDVKNGNSGRAATLLHPDHLVFNIHSSESSHPD